MISTIKKHLKYASYVFRHKWYVFVECVKLGVPFLGLTHDLSKFRPDEWIPYANYFYNMNGGPSPEECEAFDEAWLRHIHRNKHHWQWWVILRDNNGNRILDMPDKYRREMLADWIGAGKAQGNDDTAGWYAEKRPFLILHPETEAWLDGQFGLRTGERKWFHRLR